MRNIREEGDVAWSQVVRAEELVEVRAREDVDRAVGAVEVRHKCIKVRTFRRLKVDVAEGVPGKKGRDTEHCRYVAGEGGVG